MNIPDNGQDQVRADLEAIFRAGVARVDPERLVRESLRLGAERLIVATAGGERFYDLTQFERIIVLGAGKAAARMARAVEGVLGERISDGVISVKYGHTEPLERIRTMEAGHPVPDAAGVRAAQEIAGLAAAAEVEAGEGQASRGPLAAGGGGGGRTRCGCRRGAR